MLRIETRGTPHERGQQQGEAARHLAAPWIEKRLDELTKKYGAKDQATVLEQVRPQVSTWTQQLEDLYPDGAAECTGLASGLNLSTDAYFTLSFYHRLGGHLPQCTVVGSRDAQQRPLLGKTDDIGAEDLGMNLLEDTTPAHGYRHLHCHFAGTIWSVAGINECGLAMGMTGIPGPMTDAPGLFSLTALDTILPQCATVPETIAHLQDIPLNAYGFSLLLGDADGNLSLVEKTGAGMAVLNPDEHPLAHTNHILDPVLAQQNPDQSEPIRTNGHRRLDTARSLLHEGQTPQQILHDRSATGPICQRGEDDLHTDFAVVFSPVEKLMHLWPGYPDEVEMETLTL